MAQTAPNEHLLSTSYADKRHDYFTGARRDFVSLLPPDPNAAVLEIGCGSGGTGALALSERRCGRYIGVDLFPQAALEATQRLTEVVVGDIEKMTLDFPPATFDALIMSEVLEHLVDPWAVLRRIAPLLKPNALALASSPNVSHWSVIRQLAKGRFDLEERGLMDRTHMRWFTPDTYAEMFTACGFDVERVWPIKRLRGLKKVLATITRREHLFVQQMCISARRKPTLAVPRV